MKEQKGKKNQLIYYIHGGYKRKYKNIYTLNVLEHFIIQWLNNI